MISKTLFFFSVVAVFSLAVQASAINVPPTFDSTPVTQAVEGALYSYDITTSDADGDTAMVTGETLPGWLALTSWGTGEAATVSTLASLENISTGYGIDLLPSSLAVDADGCEGFPHDKKAARTGHFTFSLFNHIQTNTILNRTSSI